MTEKEMDAWKAFEAGNLEKAESIWLQLINETESVDAESQFKWGYAYVLVAMKRFDEARKIFKESYGISGDHKSLHNLAMVEREAGDYELALELIEQEAELIQGMEAIVQSANLYEKGKLTLLMGHVDKALEIALKCLEHAKTSGCDTTIGCAARLVGECYKALGVDECVNYFQLAITHFQSSEDQTAVAEVERMIDELD